MKRLGYIIITLIWIFSLIIFLFSLLMVISIAYPEISLEPELLSNSFIYLFSLSFLLINLGLLYVVFKIIKKNKFKFHLFSTFILLYLIALLSPFYLVYFSNVENLKIRADQRAFEGNWKQAIDIYCFIKPTIHEQNPNISRIQSWLKKAGYYEYKINGIADDKILEQLKVFQQKNNLVPDGFIGENTQFKLFNIIFKEKLDSIKYLNYSDKIYEELDKFILENNIIEYDGTKAILLGIMFQESLNLEANKLTVSDLRKAVKKFDTSYKPNGRFDNSIIDSLIKIGNIKYNHKSDFYIIPFITVEKEEKAIQNKSFLINRKLPAGYLWLPDYSSLSNKKQYVVFVGPFSTEKMCRDRLVELRKDRLFNNSYGILVSKQSGRKEIRIK